MQPRGVVPSPTGGSRSPWVAASPLAFGFLPGQPRWRQEGDNCPETQHLSGPVVQGAQEGGPRAAALTPQRLGMRAGATSERWSPGGWGGGGGRLQEFPLERPPPYSGKKGERDRMLVVGEGEDLGSQPGPAPAKRHEVGQVTCFWAPGSSVH